MSHHNRYISHTGIVRHHEVCHSDQAVVLERTNRGLFVSLRSQLPDKLIQMPGMKGEETKKTITIGEVLVERQDSAGVAGTKATQLHVSPVEQRNRRRRLRRLRIQRLLL